MKKHGATKWYTLSPISFRGTGGFWGRDSGLLCRTLQELGYESKVVMPFPEWEGQHSDVQRATTEELSSPQWWRELGLEGVIVAGWGRHRDTPIVRAIAESGTCCVLSIDGAGSNFPLFDQAAFVQMHWQRERWTGNSLLKRFGSTVWNVARDGAAGLIRNSYLRYRHLRYSDLALCQTPGSTEGHRQLCRLFGGSSHGVRIEHFGCPMPSLFKWDESTPKEKSLIAIGRWDDAKQKRPRLLMKVIEKLFAKDSEVKMEIFGEATPAFKEWHCRLEPSTRSRVTLHGIQPQEVMLSMIRKAQIHFSSSSGEGVPLVLFETLRCGVTSVFLDSLHLPGPRWVAECGHADLVPCDTVDAYVETVERALKKWEEGQYSPEQISSYWIERTNGKRMVQEAINLALANQKGGPDLAT